MPPRTALLPFLSARGASPSAVSDRQLLAASPTSRLEGVLPFQWRLCEITGWRPETREGATFTRARVQTKVGTEDRAYLFGGLSRDLHSATTYLSFSPTKGIVSMQNPVYADSGGTGRFKWTVQSLGEPARRRYGHATCAWGERLVMVGGARMYSRETKQRECLGDVLIYSPQEDDWAEIVPEGTPLEPRRFHSACMVGNQLLVYGGLSSQEGYLSDITAINIGQSHEKAQRVCRWTQVYARGRRPGPLAYHTCQLVLLPERLRAPGLLSLSTLPECRSSKVKV